MLRRLFAAWVLFGIVSGRAAEPTAEPETPHPSNASIPPAPAPSPADQPERPLLPLHLPGYDLRVLDVKKPLLFHVGESWVEVSVPIFLYLATPAHEEGLRRVRQVTEDLRQLLRKPAWTSAELARVQSELDAGASLLAQP